MHVALVLTLTLGFQTPPAALSETWEVLAAEFERAVVDFHRAQRTSDHEHTDRSPYDSPEFRARFEALAASGEERAIVWLLSNPRGSTDQQRAELAQLFARVRAAGDGPWMETAMHALAEERANLDRAELATWLEAQQRAPKAASLRAAAMLASAVVAEEDASRAADLRLAAAFLRWRERELAVGESPTAEEIADLATALTDGIEQAHQDWFDTGFRESDDGMYYSKADCPPDPQTVWRPAIEVVAARGGLPARVWVLSNTWPQDEAMRALIREQLEALTSERLDEKALISLAYRVSSWIKALGADFVEPRVRRLAESAEESTQALFLFQIGDGLCAEKEDAERERGLALLREVKQRWPDSEAGREVDGRIFRHTKLRVGMPIPDFEAVDVDGNAFKLSDSRGKVTVVDFWGFW